MYIRLIDSTLRKNEYLFRLNDQQKVQMRSGSYSSDLVRTNSDVRLFLWLKYEQFVSDLHHLLRLLTLTIIKKTLSSMTEIRDIKFRISQHILISVQVMISFFFCVKKLCLKPFSAQYGIRIAPYRHNFFRHSEISYISDTSTNRVTGCCKE